MDFDHSAQVQMLADLPPAPPKPPERSAWGAIWRGLQGGATKLAAAAGEAAEQVVQFGTRPDKVGQPRPDYAAKAKGARDFERTLRPDPATASLAEKVTYGLSSALAEAAAGAVVAGPVGAAAALAGAEGATVTDDLQRAGVDDATARKAGAVQGAIAGAGAVLPLAGPTLKATTALYAAGGPGGYIAQQAATREILNRAGYPEQAQQFDPLDPVGLAVSSLVPLPFAAWGAARNVRTARANALPPEAADAAMVQNLTATADRTMAGPPREALEASEPAAAPQAPAPAAAPAVARPEPAAPAPETAGEGAPPVGEQQLAGTEPAPPKREPVTVMQAVAQRVQEIEARDTGAAEAMARVRKEAQEGADGELGALDADLVRVAAECAFATAA